MNYYVDPNQTGQPVQTAPAAPSQRYVQPTPDPALRIARLVYLVFGVLEALIAIRFVMKALAANPGAAFTQFIYGVTQPFVGPFQGVFPTAQTHGSVIELSALLAIVVYALLAYVIVRLIALASRRDPPVPA